MDFLKRFIKNVLPVNQIIKFIIKQFLSSYLIYNEKDLEEKVEPETGLKNLISIDDLELNVSNINNKHLLHSPIKLLKGKFGKFKLDINDDNKLIVTIEDVNLDLMPIFNFYKKYQETIFNMEEKKNEINLEAQQDNKKTSSNEINNNNKPNNNYMLNMANKLLTNLEINIRNISVRLFTYEISEKIMDNPVFTFFILSINIYKDNSTKKNNEVIYDPNTNLAFEKSFLDNLVIDFDKLCLKLNNNIKQKDIEDFAEIKNFCNKNKALTKEQENKLINFFIDYNTIFAINYKKGPCLTIKLTTKPKIEKYKINDQEKKKIVEDMNINITIAEMESILTPNQFFNVQIFTQISNFIFTLNKNTPNKNEESDNNKKIVTNNNNKKETKKEKVINTEEEEEENDENNNEIKNDINKELNSDKILNVNMSFIPKQEKVEPPKKEEPKITEVLSHELDQFNITMNCRRIVFVSLENKDNESIPKLFSFLMEDEIVTKKKNLPLNKKEEKNNLNIIFNNKDNSFENYYCYFEDNLLLFKIDDINSVNTCINVTSVLGEYIQPINEIKEMNKSKEKFVNKSNNSKAQMSIYESAAEFEDGNPEQLSDEEVFQSVLENTELLIMENYSKFINKFIMDEYKSTKFEILTINDIKLNMVEKTIELNEIFLNINYMIILLIIRLTSKVQYFMNVDGKAIYSIEEDFKDDDNLNINLEKKINDTELQLFHNLKKQYNKNDNDESDDGNDNDIFEESIGYSEEEKKKKDGMKIKINFVSVKINNIATDPQRFDSNIYFFNLFQDIVYPNLSKIEGAKLSGPGKQYFQNILSKDYIELNIINIETIYYNISINSNINILFKEILFKYWNETILKYTNSPNKNGQNENPNITISLPVLDISLNFSEEITVNLDKNTLDNLLSFVNDFLYGLSMYQIYDKYSKDLFNNKLINLFDLFGLKNHIKALKNINNDEERKDSGDINYNKKISFDKKAIKEIEKQIMKKKPNMSIGGKVSCCVININKNKSFDEDEGNLIKIKINDIGVSLEMFDTDDNINNININNNNPPLKSKETINIEKEEPLYNIVSLSINNISLLIKEQSEESNEENIYYNLFSKNKSSKFDSTDYFFMTFKFRNLKKIKDDITILEDEEEENSDEDEEKLNKIIDKKKSKESENSKSKNSDKFKANNIKITLDPKTTDYIGFLLNNQIKLDNMEMLIDIKISETVFNSFYDKLTILSKSLSDIYNDFTNIKNNENIGPFSNPGDRIPLCEDRIMFIKCDFCLNHIFFDFFLNEDKDKKNWMRLLFTIDNFKFIFNEIGINMSSNKNYIYILKDFNYINKENKENKENMFNIEDKINEIYKEDSLMKRMGYTELFYNDKIEFKKTEKEMNINLGNINLFFCKDSYDFILDFIQIFNNNYISKLKHIFSNNEANNEENDENEEENENDPGGYPGGEKKIEEKKIEKNKKDEFKDFEVIDDVFFIDDSKKVKEGENKKIKKNYESIYLKKNPNKLETIEEYGKKRKKSKDANLADEFAIIETKSSLQRNINRAEKEKECITYLLKLCSFRVYLFQGSDFNFEDNETKDLLLEEEPLEKSDEINNIENDYNYQEKPDELHIDNNYLFKISSLKKKKISKQKRKRKDARDYSNYILLNLIDMTFKIVDFSYFDFSIDKFFIDDNFENSLYKKIISKKDFLSENSKFLICKIELMKNDVIKKEKNAQNKETTFIRINLTIPSLDIFIDQLPLIFIVKFLLSMNFDKNEINTNENTTKVKKDSSSIKSIDGEISEEKKTKTENNEIKFNKYKSYDTWEEAIEDSENKNNNKINNNEEEDDSSLIVNDILINSFSINFHYNSHKISFSYFSKGDWLELLSSLSDIKELNLKFKLYRKSYPSPIGDTLSDLINFWKDDIISNQVANSALRGLSVTRPFFKLYDGVKDLIKQPYLAYKKNEGIKRGIKKGMKNFFVSFSSQGIFFGEKIFRGMKVVVFRKTRLSLKKKSLYKAWVYKINKKQQDYEMYYYKQK